MPDPWESLRLLADPTRSRMLHLLHRGELAVGELQEILLSLIHISEPTRPCH
jgi:DNA-binding transcriptional ArsR family regulator